jgi:ribosomal protein S18 acetylase RimI-like enzyme
MTPAIREASLEDEAAVTALWDRCNLIANYNDPIADFRFALAGRSSAVLVVEDAEGRITGSVMVGHDGHRGWLYYVATAPESQGQGMGSAIVGAGEQWLRERGVLKVQLIIRETNTAVVRFYEQLGYENMPRVLMSKWLEKLNEGEAT